MALKVEEKLARKQSQQNKGQSLNIGIEAREFPRIK
jgi:hypothetical protein